MPVLWNHHTLLAGTPAAFIVRSPLGVLFPGSGTLLIPELVFPCASLVSATKQRAYIPIVVLHLVIYIIDLLLLVATKLYFLIKIAAWHDWRI